MAHPPRELTPYASPRHFFGAEVRRLRVQSGLSAAQLGVKVHYSGDMITKIEKAERWPKPELAAALDHVLATDGAFTRLLPLLEVERAASQSQEEGRGLERPEDGLRASTASPASMRSSYLRSIELVRRVEASNVGDETLELLGLAVEQLGQGYLTTPLAFVLNEVERFRHYTLGLLEGRQTLAQQRRLYEIVGWLTGLLGHIALDLGDYTSAASHCAASLRLAREAEARDLAAWVRGTQAMLALFAGTPQEATDFAEAGRAVARQSGVFAVRAAAQEARAWARRGAADQAERAMQAAQDLFAQLPAAPGSGILSFQAPYLPFYAGTMWIWLDYPDRAEASAREALAQCDAVPDQWPVARVSARFDLGMALSRRGEVEEACVVGAEALSLASARPTVPTRQRAVEFANALLPYRDLAVVEDVRDQIALMPSTTDQAPEDR